MIESKDRWAKYKAELHLYAESAGGLHLPIRSGFRTDIEYKEESRICQITFEKDEISPGSSELVSIELWLHTDEEVNYFLGVKECMIVEANPIGHVSGFALVEDKLFGEN